MASTQHVALVTSEPLPLKGWAATGAGIRGWGLAQGLRSRGYQVTIITIEPLENRPDEAVLKEAGVRLVSRSGLDEQLRQLAPDLVVMQHWGLMRYIGELDVPLAIDLAGPHLLERSYWGSPDPAADRREKLEALRRADFVCCSGRYQRHYFLPYLAMAGWDITDPHVCPVIPFSMDPQFPEVGERNASRIVSAGYFLPWQDPSAAIEATLEAIDEADRGHLDFFGGVHPALDVSQGKFEGLLDLLNSHPRASVYESMPFHQLVENIKSGGMALDLVARNPERELAFTSRTVVYLWCGLPVVYNDYSELSEYIGSYGAGATVDPSARGDIKQVIKDYLQNPQRVEEESENAHRLVKEKLDWTQTIEPLASWCAAPAFRDNKETVLNSGDLLELRLERAEKERDDARSELDTLRGKWGVKMYLRVRQLIPLLAPLVYLLTWPMTLILKRQLQDAENR